MKQSTPTLIHNAPPLDSSQSAPIQMHYRPINPGSPSYPSLQHSASKYLIDIQIESELKAQHIQPPSEERIKMLIEKYCSSLTIRTDNYYFH